MQARGRNNPIFHQRSFGLWQVGTNYGAKFSGVTAGDITFAKGLIQLLVRILKQLVLVMPLPQVFAPLFVGRRGCIGKVDFILSEVSSGCLIGTLVGISTVASLAAISRLPVADYAVVSLCVPVFAMMLSRLSMDSKITFLKCILCVILLSGVLLVTQPDFVFKMGKEDNGLGGVGRMTGFMLAFSAAISIAATNVCIAKTRGGISFDSVMIVGAAGSLISAAILPLVGFPILLLKTPTSLALAQWGALAGVASGLILYAGVLIQANRSCSPTLVTMVLSTSAAISVGVDSGLCALGDRCLTVVRSWWMAGLGAALAGLAVAAMAAEPQLERWCRRSKERDEVQQNPLTSIQPNSLLLTPLRGS